MGKKRSKDRIEKYIENRLWTQRLKGKHVSTDRIIGEVEYYFFKKNGVSMPETMRKKMVKLVKRVRNRVGVRWWKRKRKIQRWAEELGLTEEAVDMLIERGFVKSAWDVKKIKPVIAMRR